MAAPLGPLEFALITHLRRWLRVVNPPTPMLRIAFSGGADSTALLVAFHTLARHNPQLLPLEACEAFHIHHGLQPSADEMEAQARATAQRLGIRLETRYIQLPSRRPLGTEGEARKQRYATLLEGLPPGGSLWTAHHAEDQTESFWLACKRGAGPRGLGAMTPYREVAPGRWLIRPWLKLSRAQLRQRLLEAGVTWTEDPTNQAVDFDRNFLRHTILPPLQKRWPSFGLHVNASAHHCAQNESALRALAFSLFKSGLLREDGGLNRHQLQKHEEAAQAALLRAWLMEVHHRPPPSAAQMGGCLRALRRPSTQPCILQLSGASLGLTSTTLGLRPSPHLPPPASSPLTLPCEPGQPLELPEGRGRLKWSWSRPQGACWLWMTPSPATHTYTLGWSHRSEGRPPLQPPGEQPLTPHRLKLHLQAQAIPPWLRERLPQLLAPLPLKGEAQPWWVTWEPWAAWLGLREMPELSSAWLQP